MANSAIKELRTHQVVEATKRCIVEKGFANLSVKDIAAEAGVSTGVIYHYFKNKEEILLQVIKEAFRKSYDQFMAEVDPIRDPREKMLAYIDSLQAIPRDNRDFYVVLINYLGQAPSNPEIAGIVRKFFGNLTAYLSGVLAKGGVAQGIEHGALAATVIAMGLGMGVMASIDEQAYQPAAIGTALKELIQALPS